jgi:hypothetical protein
MDGKRNRFGDPLGHQPSAINSLFGLGTGHVPAFEHRDFHKAQYVPI